MTDYCGSCQSSRPNHQWVPPKGSVLLPWVCQQMGCLWETPIGITDCQGKVFEGAHREGEVVTLKSGCRLMADPASGVRILQLPNPICRDCRAVNHRPGRKNCPMWSQLKPLTKAQREILIEERVMRHIGTGQPIEEP